MQSLSVCNAIHSQSSAWCSPQVSCPWLLPPIPSGLRHFHIQAEVPMKTKQRYLCAELPQENPANTERNVKMSSGKSQNFQAAAPDYRGSRLMSLSERRGCWDPWRSLREDTKRNVGEGGLARTAQRVTNFSITNNYYAKELREWRKGTCVLLRVGENWLPPMPGG